MESRDFRESARKILAGAARDEALCELLTALGEETTMLNAIHLALCLKAMKGDVQAAKYLRETAEGEDGEEGCGSLLPDLTALSDRELRALAERFPEEGKEVTNDG